MARVPCQSRRDKLRRKQNIRPDPARSRRMCHNILDAEPRVKSEIFWLGCGHKFLCFDQLAVCAGIVPYITSSQGSSTLPPRKVSAHQMFPRRECGCGVSLSRWCSGGVPCGPFRDDASPCGCRKNCHGVAPVHKLRVWTFSAQDSTAAGADFQGERVSRACGGMFLGSSRHVK